MQPIHVRRFGENPHGHQGEVEAADKSWRVVIDRDGYPQLWFRICVGANEDGTKKYGYACVDDFIEDGLQSSVADLMQGEFSGIPTPEEEVDAEKYWGNRWASQDGKRCEVVLEDATL